MLKLQISTLGLVLLGLHFLATKGRADESTSDNGPTVKVWDAATGQELLTLNGHRESVNSLAFSPDGMWLATAGSDETVKVWNAATGQELFTLQGQDRLYQSLKCVAFSPDSKQLASASTTVKLWDISKGQELLTLKGYTHVVISVAFNPDGKQLASASLF